MFTREFLQSVLESRFILRPVSGEKDEAEEEHARTEDGDVF